MKLRCIVQHPEGGRCAPGGRQARSARPRCFCEPLECRMLLSGGAPAALSTGDVVVLFGTAGTGPSAPPVAMRIDAMSATVCTVTDLLNPANDLTGTFAYKRISPTSGTLTDTDANGFHTIMLGFASGIVSNGSYTYSDLKGSGSGQFVFAPVSAPVLATTTLAGDTIVFNLTGGGGRFSTSGSFSVQAGTTGKYILQPISGSTTASSGTFTYAQTFQAGGKFTYSDITDGINNLVQMGFTTRTTGYFYNTNAGTGATDYQIGTFVIPPAVNTTALVPTPNPVIMGSSVTFQATVSPNTAGGNTATGTVTFMDGPTVLGAPSLDGTGHASLPISNLTLGTHVITAVYSGDANFARSSSPAVSQFVVYAHAVNLAYVDQLYIDLLGRTADSGGATYWTGLLDAGSTIQTVAAGIQDSNESNSNIVSATYQNILGRAADPGGLAYWTGQLDAGYSLNSLRASFLGSSEYYADCGGTDTLWITAVYHFYLDGRDPDSSGLAYWKGVLLNTGVSPVVTQRREYAAALIGASLEYYTDIVSGYYTKYLLHAADSDGLSMYANILYNGTETTNQVIVTFVTMPEYFTAHNLT